MLLRFSANLLDLAICMGVMGPLNIEITSKLS